MRCIIYRRCVILLHYIVFYCVIQETSPTCLVQHRGHLPTSRQETSGVSEISKAKITLHIPNYGDKPSHPSVPATERPQDPSLGELHVGDTIPPPAPPWGRVSHRDQVETGSVCESRKPGGAQLGNCPRRAKLPIL